MTPVPELLDVRLLLPEIIILIMGCMTLICGAFGKKSAFSSVGFLSLAGFAVAAALIVMNHHYLTDLRDPYSVTVFNDLLRIDAFGSMLKLLVLAGAAAAVVFGWRYFAESSEPRFEYFVLIMMSVLGMMVMLSADNFLALYVGLELQSLALYVLASIDRDNSRSTEAGVKYFVLGALSSGMLLFGISLIYGFSGTVQFGNLAAVMIQSDVSHNLGLMTGLVFLMAGLAFKISAVPFHMWTPDVYEGSPTPVTAFFAVAPKVAALGMMIRVLGMPFAAHPELWQQIVVFLSAASMLLGAVAALRQTNIKRLLAYSSIGHMGFVLLGIAAVSQEGARAMIVYMMIYLVMSVGAFACVLAMRRGGKYVEQISDLSGLSKTHPVMALCLLIILFSMAGIPPLAGFFAKFYVIIAALNSQLYILAVIAVLSSVISAYYYLYIIKVMYFDDAKNPLDRYVGWELRWITVIASILLLSFILAPDSVMAASARAAAMILTPAS